VLRHLDLFSGIGGFSLACEWTGIETIGFVENDKYCQKVLRKHWPDVPIVEDIRDVEKIKEIVANAQYYGWSDAEGKQGIKGVEQREGWEKESYGSKQSAGGNRGLVLQGGTAGDPKPSAILITAGFPCQPFSVAGKRGSYQDDRYLWPETLAVIEAIKPKWVLLENVAGIINLALDTVLSDLEGAGYSYETLVIPACAVNAPHRRDRIWIIAHTADNRCNRNDKGSNNEGEIPENKEQSGGRWTSRIEGYSSDVADSTNRGTQRSSTQCNVGRFQSQVLRESRNPNHWAVEPELGRVAHGIPCRVDRLKCLGNAIVPQVAYQIIKVIKEIDIELGA